MVSPCRRYPEQISRLIHPDNVLLMRNQLHESGSNDLLLPTDNSILMWKKLSHLKAQLHLFPDAGHGFLFQYATELAKIINDFLDGTSTQGSKL